MNHERPTSLLMAKTMNRSCSWICLLNTTAVGFITCQQCYMQYLYMLHSAGHALTNQSIDNILRFTVYYL